MKIIITSAVASCFSSRAFRAGDAARRVCRRGLLSASLAVLALLSADLSFAAPLRSCEMTVTRASDAETFENFPILVKISPTRIDGFAYSQCAENGADISFADSATGATPPFEIESWKTTGDSFVWVRLPSCAAGETKFRFRWNDPTPATRAPVSDVWKYTGYSCVWHMNQNDTN